MSSYIGYFNDLKGVQHTVTIGSGTTNTEITLTDTPFVTSMDESDSTIYKPVKYQSGTLGILSEDSDYMFDIYTGSAQGVKVTLSHGSTVDWVGYVTPSLYNIGYVTPDEPMDVDLIDGLSTLQYYKYDSIDTTAGIHTLLDIIVHCIKKCGCYSKVVYSVATKIRDSNNYSLIERGSLSEQFAFDEDSTETDRENDKTYQEVLESIMTYLNLTCFAVGDTVYVIDVDNPNATYLKEYDLSTDTATELSNDYSKYTITASSYATSDSTLSLDNTYQKVTVTDEYSTFDAMFGDWFDGNEQNITIDDSGIKGGIGENWWGDCVNSTKGGGGTGNLKMLVMLNHFDGSQNDDGWNALAVKYYDHPKFTFYKYGTTGSDITSSMTGINMTSTINTIGNGAFPARFYVEKLEDNDWCETWTAGHIDGTNTQALDDAFAENDISSIDVEDYLVLINHKGDGYTHIKNTDTPKKFVEMTGNATRTTFFGGDNAYLIISGTIYWGDRNKTMYPVPDGEVDIYNGRKELDIENAALRCRLVYGSLYWNGSEWMSTSGVSETDQIFKIPFAKDTVRSDDSIFGKANDIVNTVTWRIGTDEKGYLIPMPSSGAVLTGNPKLTIYNSKDFCSWNNYNYDDDNGSYWNIVMFIKDFKLSAVVADPTFSDESDDDTSYTNVINLDNATELDDITFDVCTYDGKNPNYNSVAYADANGDYHYVDTTSNWVTMAKEADVTRYDGSSAGQYGLMRQEEHLVWRITNQYTEPAKVLELTLNEDINPIKRVHESNLNTDFLIDKVDRDYKYCEFTYKLIEKK